MSSRSRRDLAIGLALGGLLALPAFALRASADESAAVGEDATAARSGPAATRPRVLLIGVDALSLNVLEPLMKQGALPHMQQLAEQGAMGPLASYWPLRTMQVWTSAVTGKLPDQHGIWDHVKSSNYNPPAVRTDKRAIYTPADRRSQALWGLVGERGIRSLTVGWPSTWPAERVKNGVMVAPKVLYGDPRRVTIKGSFWRHVGRAVQPARLAAGVRALIVEPDEVDARALARLADPPPADSPLRELPKIDKYIYSLRWNLARARSVEAITLELARSQGPEVVLAYFQCPDSLGHRFWIFSKPIKDIKQRLAQWGLPVEHAAELKKRFGSVIANCHRDVDARIGRLLDALAGPETLVLVISDHGFGDGPKPHPFRAEPYGGIHWSDGAILARGPGVRPGSRPEGLSVLDITPSLLYQFGLPVAEDMQGDVAPALVGRQRLQQRPIETVPSYEDQPQLELPHAGGYPPKPDSFVW